MYKINKYIIIYIFFAAFITFSRCEENL